MKKLNEIRSWSLSRYYSSLISPPDPRVWHLDITNSCWVCKELKEGSPQARQDEEIERKVDILHILNGILAKTRNRILQKQKQNQWFGFLVDQSDAAKRLSSKTTWLRRTYFLKMHHIINSCANMRKIYDNKDAKSCTTWRFPSYREDEIRLETCWHVWQVCRVINSSVECGYCDTTRFHKNRP